MAKRFLTPIDLNKNELRNAVIQVLASAPGSPVEGQTYYDSTLKVERFYNGTAWIDKQSGVPDTEATQDIIGAMVTGNTESGITVAYDDTGGVLNFTVTDSPLLQGQNSAYHLARANHTGTQLAATISDFTEAAQDAVGTVLTDTATVDFTYNDAGNTISAAVLDSPLLGGQNSAYHLARANHSGTQLVATISDFSEAVDDRVGALIVNGTNTTVTYNDAGNSLTVNVSGLTSAALSDFTEAAQDAVGGALTDTATLDLTYNDAGNTISGAVLDSPLLQGQNSAYHLSRANHTGTQSADTLTDGTTNKAFLATERTKLAGIATGATANQTDAFLLARANHTGTQTAATISDFDTQVRTSRLDQMAAPTASVSMNSQKITNVLDPTTAQDAATKAYVDATAAGIDWKASVRAATTANVATLAGGAPNTIDGVTLAANDRLLVKNQGTGSQNGIYFVATLGTGANGTWTRATDADASTEMTSGVAVFVEEGTVNGDTGWVLTTNNPITLGTTALTFTQFTSLGMVTAGAGMTQTGSTIDVVGGATAGSGGAGGGLVVNANDVVIDTNVVVRKYAVAIGDGTSTAIVVTHSLGTRDVTCCVYTNSGVYDEVECDIEHTSTTTCTVRFSVAPAASAYRFVAHG